MKKHPSLAIQHRTPTEWLKEAENQLDKITNATNIHSGTMLDNGCGPGHIPYTASSKGFYGIGLEPDHTRLLFKGNIVVGIGEYLPFRDNCFDVMCSLSVLEHVQDWKQVCKEIVRVLKRGGKLYIYFPNYFHPYEHHYQIFFLPIPKQLARGYIQTFRQKNADYINSLQYVYTLKVKKLFAKLGGSIRDLTVNRRNPIRKLVARLGLLEGAWLVITK